MPRVLNGEELTSLQRSLSTSPVTQGLEQGGGLGVWGNAAVMVGMGVAGGIMYLDKGMGIQVVGNGSKGLVEGRGGKQPLWLQRER